MTRKNNIWQFLDTLNKYELANFYFYKYETFMENSQKIIDDYFLNKNMSKDKIKELVEEHKNMAKYEKYIRKDCCPQCYSLKKVKTKQLWCPLGNNGIAVQLDNERIMIDVEDCLICGYKFSNLNRPAKKDNWIIKLLKPDVS